MLKKAGDFYDTNTSGHAACYHQPLCNMRSGQYIADLPHYGPANFTTIAGTLYAGIFSCSLDITIDRLGINITSAGAEEEHARLGIYTCNEELYPEGLLLDAGLVDVSANGNAYASAEKHLPRGFYFLCLLAESAFTCSYLKLSQSPLGLYPTFAACYTGYSVLPGWGELPEVFPTGGNHSNVVRLVAARLKNITVV